MDSSRGRKIPDTFRKIPVREGSFPSEIGGVGRGKIRFWPEKNLATRGKKLQGADVEGVRGPASSEKTRILPVQKREIFGFSTLAIFKKCPSSTHAN